MSAEQLLKVGDVTAAIASLKQQIRADAANPKYRVFLFQLLAVAGEWQKALDQLNVIGELDAGAKKNYIGPDGLTLAMAAAGRGKLSAMQYAYELDPNLKAVARGGRSVMHVAVSNRTAPEPEAVITFLSDKGAQLDPLDERKSTPGDDLNRGGAENIRVFFIQLLRDKGIVSLAH